MDLPTYGYQKPRSRGLSDGGLRRSDNSPEPQPETVTGRSFIQFRIGVGVAYGDFFRRNDLAALPLRSV